MSVSLFAAIRTVLTGITLTLTTIAAAFGQANDEQNIIEMGAVSKVFSQEGVPVPNNQSSLSLSPDGKTAYISDNYVITVSKLENGHWTKPKPISISGHWKDWDATLSPDGKRLVFVSNRPLEGAPQDKPQKDNHLWESRHLSGENWSTPRHLDSPVNKKGVNAYAPAISKTGSLCFCSRDRDGHKGMGGYYTRWLGDHYDRPQLLALNGDKEIYDPFISPDERYIIFVSEGGLYISYRRNNQWQAGEKLSVQVNNGSDVNDPYVSPDGKMLYYSSNRPQAILMIRVNTSVLAGKP